MLYKKKSEPSLTDELFKNPTAEYRSAPFWAWNSKLEKEELLWQIEEFKKMGFGGAHMHVRAGMETKYLSDEFMDLIKSCTEKFKKEDMLSYLYDEDKWPSGFAGGYVTKTKKYRAHSVKFTETKFESAVDMKTALQTGKPCLLAVYDIVICDDGNVSANRIGENDTANGKKRYAYFMTAEDNDGFNGQSYVDTLSPEAIKKFISVTHEKYKKAVGDEFGKTINTIFTDEPQFTAKVPLPSAKSDKDGVIPYTEKFGEEFLRINKYDILDKLPDLFYETGTEKKTRYDFYNLITGMFANAFSETIGKWCDENGINLTGHMMQEDNLEVQTRWIGEAMRHYKYFGIPGIDLLSDNLHFTTAKQCQSAVHQYGKEGMLSELYGVTDWTYDFRGYKFQGDWQAALGVTLRVPHLSWVSMKGSAKRDYPASISYQSPWYKEYSYLEDHFARLNTALTRGKPVVKVAVVHPIETCWLYDGTNENTTLKRRQLDDRFLSLTEWLLYNAIDFDFVSEAELATIKTDFTNGFTVGEMTYDAVVLPALETIRKTTLNALIKYKENDGRIVVLDSVPERLDGAVSAETGTLYEIAKIIPYDESSVVEELKDLKTVSVYNYDGNPTDNLIYAERSDGEDEWIFIAHGKKFKDGWECKNVPHDQRIVIKVKTDKSPVLYDTLSGEKYIIPFERENGEAVIKWSLYNSDSLLFKFTDTPEGKDITEDPLYTLKIKSFPDRMEHQHYHGIREEDVVSYEREEDNVLILDECVYSYDGGEFRPKKYVLHMTADAKNDFGYPSMACQPWAIKAEKPKHKITVKYDFYSETAFAGACLATEDYKRSLIKVNGKRLVKKPTGYFVDKSCIKLALPKLKKGLNTVEITMPFGARDNFEPVYITGDFNVKLEGVRKTIVKKTEKIGYGDITAQGMPFYGGNIRYKTEFTAKEAGRYCITASCYSGALIKVYIDGEYKGRIVFSPYELAAELSEGKHEIIYEFFGNRNNCSGSIHNTNTNRFWVSPDHWYTKGAEFSFEYVLSPIGITASPIIEKIDD